MDAEPAKRKVSLTVDPNIAAPATYDEFLITFSEDQLRIDFATLDEAESRIAIEVKDSVAIPADMMKTFLARILNAMIGYEKTYQNGKGFELDEEIEE